MSKIDILLQERSLDFMYRCREQSQSTIAKKVAPLTWTAKWSIILMASSEPPARQLDTTKPHCSYAIHCYL